MKTKETPIEKFAKGVDSLGKKLLDEKQGYVMFCYSETEDGKIQSHFSSKGKIIHNVECIYACMKTNPMLANIILAAGSAIAQNRLQQAVAEQEKNKETTEKE
jgi:hypothetical protein